MIKYSYHDFEKMFSIMAHPDNEVLKIAVETRDSDYTCDGERMMVTVGSDKMVKLWTGDTGRFLCQHLYPGSVFDIKINLGR